MFLFFSFSLPNNSSHVKSELVLSHLRYNASVANNVGKLTEYLPKKSK